MSSRDVIAGILAAHPLDYAVIDELRSLQDGAESDLVAEVVNLFLADSPRRLAAMAQAIEAGDAANLRREAHGLKGSAANVGGVGVRAICEHLERLGRTGSVGGADQLFEGLSVEYGRLVESLTSCIRAA